LQKLQKIGRPRHEIAGATLFREGDCPVSVYFFCVGQAQLVTTSSSGKTLVVRPVFPGDVLGLAPMITGQRHHLTLEILQASKFHLIYREHFLEFLKGTPDAYSSVLNLIARECQFSYSWIRTYGLPQSIPGKIARLFLQYCDQATETGDSLRIPLNLTHEDIARLVGTSRESVTRTIGTFRKQGILAADGEMLLIHSRMALEHVAEFSKQRMEDHHNAATSGV